MVSDAVTAIYTTANITEGTPLTNAVYNENVANKIKLARAEYDKFASEHPSILKYAASKLAELEACEAFRATYYDPAKINVLVKPVTGSGQVIDTGQGTIPAVQFSFSDALSNFIYIKVDGVELNASQYSASETPFTQSLMSWLESSTDTFYISLSADYIKTLSLGKHEILVSTDNGMAKTSFTLANYWSHQVVTNSYANGYSLVKYTGTVIDGKVPYMEGQAMCKLPDGNYYSICKNPTKLTSNSFKQVEEGPTSVLRKGDVNRNGSTNIVDAQVAFDIANAVYGDFTSATIPMWLEADVHTDNVVDAQDARAIQAIVHSLL